MSALRNKVWLITGCSSGLGHALAQQALERGDQVVLTARNRDQLESLTAQHGDNALSLALDITNGAMIDRAVAEAEAHFGRLDVLVNNAGYAYFAAVEEGEDEEVRRQFETNVFGLFSLTRRVLPGMRARRSGHIINVSSIGGLMALPATGYYHASKFAVEGFSEALAQEVAPLGINVTIVSPGRFRTNATSLSLIESKTTIDDYAETAGARRKKARETSGAQPGDPARAADAILEVADHPEPPLHLLLGSDAYDLAHAKLDALGREFLLWRDLTVSTDFPQR